jgi:hypothetical protein
MDGSTGKRVMLHGVQIEDEDFSGRRLDNLSIANGSRLTRCNFRRAQITGGGLGGGRIPSTYVGCVFDDARIKKIVPGRATFISCSFRNVTLSDVHFLEAEFIECTFSGLIRRVIFSARSPIVGTDLERKVNRYIDNDFSEAELVDVAFRRGIDLNRQRMPSGPDYLLVKDAPSVLRYALEEAAHWSGGDAKEAEVALRSLLNETKNGQDQIIVRLPEILENRPETVERLRRLLSQ